MGTVPAEGTFTTGVINTASDLNAWLRDGMNFALAPPRATLTASGGFSVASGTSPTVISAWNTATVNSDTMWAATPNPSRLVANTPGLFEFGLLVHYPFNATAHTVHCGISLNNNGGTWFAGGLGNNRLAEDTRPGSQNSALGTSTEVYIEQVMNVGDYVEFYTAQTCGSTLSVPGGAFGCQAIGRWVAAG